MPSIIPQSELHRKALDWIIKNRPEKCDAACLRPLIEEAAMRFNLGPLDVEFLQRFLLEGHDKGD